MLQCMKRKRNAQNVDKSCFLFGVRSLYKFPDEIRKAYELLPIPLVIDQQIDGRVVPLLVS